MTVSRESVINYVMTGQKPEESGVPDNNLQEHNMQDSLPNIPPSDRGPGGPKSSSDAWSPVFETTLEAILEYVQTHGRRCNYKMIERMASKALGKKSDMEEKVQEVMEPKTTPSATETKQTMSENVVDHLDTLLKALS